MWGDVGRYGETSWVRQLKPLAAFCCQRLAAVCCQWRVVSSARQPRRCQPAPSHASQKERCSSTYRTTHETEPTLDSKLWRYGTSAARRPCRRRPCRAPRRNSGSRRTPRVPETTRDCPRLPESTRDCPRLPGIARDSPGPRLDAAVEAVAPSPLGAASLLNRRELVARRAAQPAAAAEAAAGARRAAARQPAIARRVRGRRRRLWRRLRRRRGGQEALGVAVLKQPQHARVLAQQGVGQAWEGCHLG